MLTPEQAKRKAELDAVIGNRLRMAPTYIPRQREAIETIEVLRKQGHVVPKLLYGGAMGGAKSFYGCRRAIQLSEEHPGIRGYMCRAEAAAFKNTTLITMLSPAPDGVDVLGRPGWHHNISGQRFTHDNGSRLDYGGLASDDDRDRVKSMNITFGFVDEASDVDQVSARLLEARCNRQSDFTAWAFMLYTSNPEPCWLQADFIDNPRPGCAFVQALPRDNPFLPVGYFDHLRETYSDMPELLDAYLNGSWAALGKMDKVFPSDMVSDAMKRDAEPGEPVEWGVDVARFGDDRTVVYERRGLVARRIQVWEKQDTHETSEKIAALYAVSDPKPTAIKVDDIGLGGGVTDNLKASHLPVIPVNVGASAIESDKFANLRAELAWHLRVVLKDGGDLPQDEGLRSQLTAMKLAYKSGRMAVEPKADIKKRLGRSPDDADALILAFAPDTTKSSVWDYYLREPST